MLDKVKRYLRIMGDGDNLLLVSLIQGAKQYLHNAGVVEPEPDPESEPEEPDGEEGEDGEGEEPEPEPVLDASPRALYELAVTLYVNMLCNGATEDSLDRAMTAIILQIKDYGGGEE